jgi:hypothetical protein
LRIASNACIIAHQLPCPPDHSGGWTEDTTRRNSTPSPPGRIAAPLLSLSLPFALFPFLPRVKESRKVQSPCPVYTLGSVPHSSRSSVIAREQAVPSTHSPFNWAVVFSDAVAATILLRLVSMTWTARQPFVQCWNRARNAP